VRLLPTITVLLVLASPLARAAGLQAGAAETVITPDLARYHPLDLAGFGHNRLATGVHDNLTARCLALAAGGQRLVVCSVDLIGLFHHDVLAIRREFDRLTPAPAFLIVAATHTHAGPDTLGLYGPRPLVSGVNPQYLRWIEARVAATAAGAVRNLQPAALVLGRDDNPLLALLQGVDRPPIVKDPYLFAMRLRSRSTGKTIATLVNWSDHPETLGRRNTEITADYPYWARTALEKQYGGIALFFSGALGKVSPLGEVFLPDPQTGTPAADGTWEKARLLGEAVATQAERALDGGATVNIDSLEVRSATVFVPLDNPQFRAAITAGVFGGRRPLYTAGRPDDATTPCMLPGLGSARCAAGHDLRTEVDVVRLRSAGGLAAEIATVPGEIYPELVNGGIARYPGADFPKARFEPVLRPRFHARYQFIFGLGNDEIGYLIPKAEWDGQPPWLRDASKPWYGEINSVGPDAAGAVLRALARLLGSA
jgi:hypothetical protein